MFDLQSIPLYLSNRLVRRVPLCRVSSTLGAENIRLHRIAVVQEAQCTDYKKEEGVAPAETLSVGSSESLS